MSESELQHRPLLRIEGILRSFDPKFELAIFHLLIYDVIVVRRAFTLCLV